MSVHSAVHNLVFALKALGEADQICTSGSVITLIREARRLIWEAGEEIGIDMAAQIRKLSETD